MKTFKCTLLFAVCVSCNSAWADLIVEFNNATLSPGGLGHIDVLIGSSSGLDQLGRFSGKFRITKLSGDGILEFQPSFNSMLVPRQSNSERLDPDYIFFGSTGATGFLSIRDANDKGILSQGDNTNSTTTNVSVSSTFLLARLELQHISPTQGDAQYRIELVNDPFTFFRLADNTTSVPVSNQSFSNFGLVNVTAVPEPSWGFLAPVMAMVFGSRRRRVA